MIQTAAFRKSIAYYRKNKSEKQRLDNFYPVFSNPKNNPEGIFQFNNDVQKTTRSNTLTKIAPENQKKRWTIKLASGNDDVPIEVKQRRAIMKYYKMRHALFSKYDAGIQLDVESWYSVTPESIAKEQARRCKCDVIIDGFCGAGGNTIQLAMTCNKVISIDIDEKKIEIAKNNAKIYGVDHKIEFIVGDFFEVVPKLKADAIFLSPPWGGPDYAFREVFDLHRDLEPKPLKILLSVSRKITPNLALFIPRNSNRRQLSTAIGISGYQIQKNKLWWNGKTKNIAITVYTGKFKVANKEISR